MNKTDSYLFHFYDLQRTSSLTTTRFLFNTARHLRLQSASNWLIYEIGNPTTGTIKARIAFHVEGETALSPFRAPFGFVEIYKKTRAEVLVDFFSFIEEDLKPRGVKRIQLKSYSQAYDKNIGSVEGVLQQLNYSTTREVTSIISVDRKLFEKKIKISERQKLRKAEKMFLFEKLKITQLKEIYSFIEDCRKERNQRLSMTYSDLKKSIQVFPRNFFLYRVYDASGTAAAAIVIKINKTIWYTFYYAHSSRYDKVSPVVLLIRGIYTTAQEQGIEMIDLGTSMLDGKIHRSLLHFKQSIGGESHPKLIFDKDLV